MAQPPCAANTRRSAWRRDPRRKCEGGRKYERERETLEHEGVLEESHGRRWCGTATAGWGGGGGGPKEGEGFKASAAVGSWPRRLRLRWAEATTNKDYHGPIKPTTNKVFFTGILKSLVCDSCDTDCNRQTLGSVPL
jgi:hypothetical protein